MAKELDPFVNPLVGVEGDPYAGTINPRTGANPAANFGLGALAPGLADRAVGLQAPATTSQFEMGGGLATPPNDFLGAFQQYTPMQFAQAMRAPVQQPAPALRLGYDPQAGKYLINNTVVDARDIQTLQRVPELVQEPVSPELPAGNWYPTDLQSIKQAKDELLNISIGERIGFGAADVAGSIPSGFGRMLEFAGAEGLGEAFVGLGERLSPDEFDQARMAAVQQSQNIFQEIATGVPQGLPSVLASVGSSIVGGAIGGLAAGPAGVAAGAIIGGASTIFPMMVNSAYDTALQQQGEEFVQSPEGRAQILGTALATTGVQMIPGMQVTGKVVPALMQRAATQVANKATSSIAGEAAKIGFSEGMAEMMALVIEQAAFDPETRAMMSEGEVDALLPYVAETYGREAAVAFSVGAILGGGIGAATGAITRPPQATEVETEGERNLLVPTEERPAAPEFTGEMRGLGPQGVLPMEGLGGRIERARRSRQVGYQPPRTGEQTNLLERPAPVVDEAQLDLGFAEEAVLPEPSRPTVLGDRLTSALRQQEFEQAVMQRRERETTAAEAERQLQIAEDARLAEEETPVLRQPGESVPQQRALFTRRQAPALSRSEQLRRGIQRVPDVLPPVVESDIPAPAQGELFTRRGRPTAAARVSTTAVEPGELFGRVDGSPFRTEVSAVGQRRRVSRDRGIPVDELEVTQTDDGFFLRRRGEEVVAGPVVEEVVTEEVTGVPEDAIQEPSPAAVPAREGTEVSPEVGEEVSSVQEAAEEGQEVTQETLSLVPASDTEYVNELVEIIENTKDKKQYVDSIADLLGWGQDADLDSNLKRAGLDKRIFAYLNSLPIDAATQQAVMQFARFNGKPIQATYVSGESKGELKPVFKFILKAEMLDTIRNRYGFTNLPAEYGPAVVNVDEQTGEQTSPQDGPEDRDTAKAEKLARKIKDLNSSTAAKTDEQIKKDTEKLTELYQSVTEAGLEDFEDTYNKPLSSYFRPDGTPNVVLRDRVLRVTSNQDAERSLITTPDMLEQYDVDEVTGEPVRRASDRLRRRTQGTEEEALLRSMGMDGMFSTADNKPITKKLSVGEIKIAVNTFKNKLRAKPRTFVFRNQADLQASNPELYQKAVAARPQGDFDTKVAAGYSFGGTSDPTVIIFSDRIANKAHLNFVLAHETLGHFGFRAILPSGKVKSFMESIYNDLGEHSALTQQVDGAMAANPELTKAEAVEEYLADFAAQLDVSLIARIANFIKNALNRLGVEFVDDAARHFVNQSRMYVRNGATSNLFVNSQVIKRIRSIELGEDPDGTGMYAPTATLRDLNMAATELSSSIPMNVEAAQKWLRENGPKLKTKAELTNFFDSFDRFKNKFFNLLIYRARENEGLSRVNDVITESRDYSTRLKRGYQEKLAIVLDRAILERFADNKFLGGATEKQLDTINEYLYEGMRYAIGQYDPRDLYSESLYSVEDGTVTIKEDVVNDLFAKGTLSPEQMRDGFTIKLLEGGTRFVKGLGPKLTKDSFEYRGYKIAREAMRDVELDLLKAKVTASLEERNLSFKTIDTYMENGQLLPSSKRFLVRMYNVYKDTWSANPIQDEDGELSFNPDSMQKADDFLATLNRALIADNFVGEESVITDDSPEKRNEALAEYFPEGQRARVQADVEAFKANRKTLVGEDRYGIQSELKKLITADIGNGQDEVFVKYSILTGYTPLVRRGDFEVRVKAFNEAGNEVTLPQHQKNQLAYMQFENLGEAKYVAEQMNNELFAEMVEADVYNDKEGKLESGKVRLEASFGPVLDAQAAPPQLNLNEFIQGLNYFNFQVPPSKLKKIILDLTRQNSNARKRLQRQDVIGADKNAIRAISEHIESRAAIVAKTLMRPKLAQATNLRDPEIRKLWYGDKQKLDTLEAEWNRVKDDPTESIQAKQLARTEYNKYALMYYKTNPKSGGNQGNKYFNEASRLLRFLENNEDINESDFARSKTVSTIRAATSILQLGGSIATGALNYMAILTNVMPYLNHYNPEKGFGGGFAFGDINREIFMAFNQVGLVKSVLKGDLNKAEFYDKVAESDTLQKQLGIKDHEARFLAREIREGVMIPAQINMLTETALNRIGTTKFRRLIEGYMWTFNATERASRRSAGLAAYRLEYKRQIEANVDKAEAASAARKFAVEALRVTLGEYAVTNRPAAWQTGLASFIYIYKVFPTTSIQLLGSLPKKGQAQMLGTLLLLSGVSGLPFAEDLEDIIDTLGQKLGIGSGSIRKEAAELADAILPGSSAYFLTGAVRSFLPFDLAGRTSLGNFAPGTSMFLAGANTSRELAEIAGPAWSMLAGVGTTISQGYKALTTEQVTLEDVLRDAPATGARMLGDALAYYSSGAIVDRRGYVVSPDMHGGVIASRLLGFYPSSAAEQYQIIRVSKRITDYQREVSAGFRYGWIKAKMRGDEEQARVIEDAVKEWNKVNDNKIKDFKKNATRALKEARRPAQERLLRSAPTRARGDIEQIADQLGYE